METKRIVDINTYWAEIIRDTAQFGQIAVAENPEFNRLAECIFRALEDSFIHSATEYGVKRWESMLQIAPSAGETLEERKARILTYLNLKLPYTWRVLKQLLEGIVGEDKVTLDYVNDEGKLIVHTDRISDEKLQTVRDLIERVVPMNLVVEQYNHHIEVSWRDINKYAECVTVADMKAVNADYKNDLTAEGEWIYPLDSLVNGNELFRKVKAIKHIYLYAPKCTSTNRILNDMANLESAYIYLPSFVGEGGNNLITCGSMKLKKIEIELNQKTVNLKYAFTACYSLSEFKMNDLPALSSISNGFSDTQLNKESILRLLNQLPTWASGSHPATIGIHVDHKTDEEVLAAIAEAEAKGWTLTVQWKGTPTSGVSTLDLEELYAKVTESEYGEYTDENGTRCSLDWGHYVTDTTGYKLFFSIYEAEQYYKLTKIEGIEE